MKKLIVCVVLAVVSANAGKLSEDELANLRGSCTELEDKSACQKLIKNGLTSVEKCGKDECSEIGGIYSTAENFQQALKYYVKACELGNFWGCSWAADLYKQGLGVKKDEATAKKYYGKACELGNEDACKLSK